MQKAKIQNHDKAELAVLKKIDTATIKAEKAVKASEELLFEAKNSTKALNTI